MRSRRLPVLLLMMFLAVSTVQGAAHPLDQLLSDYAALTSFQQMLPDSTRSRFAQLYRWSLQSSRGNLTTRIVDHIRQRPEAQVELKAFLDGLSAKDAQTVAGLQKALEDRQAFSGLHHDALPAVVEQLRTIRPPLAKMELRGLRPVLRPANALSRTRALPKIGTMKGVFRDRKIMLTFNRTFWTITGNHGAHDVGLNISHESSTIFGRAYGDALSLGFDWSPEMISQQGTVADVRYDMVLDWEAGTAQGWGMGKAIRLQFSIDDGRITGWMPGGQVNLTFNELSGVLQGTVGGKFCQLTLTNVDLYDFLQHLYLFLEV